jgi:hypothetical protein
MSQLVKARIDFGLIGVGGGAGVRGSVTDEVDQHLDRFPVMIGRVSHDVVQGVDTTDTYIDLGRAKAIRGLS